MTKEEQVKKDTQMAIGQALRAQANARPERPFLWCGEDRFTFGEADARSDQVAAGLADLGVRPGENVAIISTNRTEMLELYFACAKLGAVQVPLNVFLKGEFLRYQLADSEAATLIVDKSGYEATIPLLSQLPTLKRVVQLDGKDDAVIAGKTVVHYRAVRASNAAVPAINVAPNDLMSIVYTSGTTGFPKGCMLSHGYYLCVAKRMNERFEMTEDDLIFTGLPLFHGAARMMAVAAALRNGSAIVVEPAFRLTGLMERIAETGATFMMGVGAMGMAMLSMPPSDADRAHKLRLALLIPFPAIQQEVFEQRFGTHVHAELFGQTECVPITVSPLSGRRSRASVGLAVDDLEVRLLDDADNEVPVGQVGEFSIRPRLPNAMFKGYWRKAEATLETFRDLWHHTGDYGRQDQEGFFYFVDRKKDAIRRKGENISSLELEAAIAAHPKILEVAVHAVPSELTDEEVKACVVLRQGQTLEAAELFAFFKEKLPYFAIPRYVEVVTDLPKTEATARVMKQKLRERGITETTWDFNALGFTLGREVRR